MKRKLILAFTILLLAVGFAATSTTLTINGGTNISENIDDLSVIFTAASLDGTDVYASVIDETKEIISFSTSGLTTLNQTSVLTYEITNNSSNYDANISVDCKAKDNTTAKYTSIKNELEENTTKVLAKDSVNGTLTATLNQTVTGEVRDEYVCTLTINALERDTLGEKIPAFQKDSWSTIAANVKAGNTSKYNVGDTKEVDLGDLGTHTVRVANKSECTNGETSETACGFVVEFADVITKHSFNSQATNVGGWRDSKLRTYINDTIYKSLPSDLQNVITSTKVISGHGKTSGETNFETQDKLYLLSAHEVMKDGKSYQVSGHDTSYNNTKQLDYYKYQGGTTSSNDGAIKQYHKVEYYWWLRSADSSNTDGFLLVDGGGSWGSSSASLSNGVSPAFRLQGPEEPIVAKPFATDSWDTIQKAVQMGNTSKYNVGDTKEVDLGDLGTHTVRIANKSECTTETSETACGFVVEFADIITKQRFLFDRTDTNVGGWRDSNLRTYINDTIYKSLPIELQNVITSTKVISGHGSTSGETNFETQDKLYLLCGHEVYEDGTSNKISTYDTSYSNTKQLDYYKDQGVTTSSYVGAIKQHNGSNDWWWLRSANSRDTNYLFRIDDGGVWYKGYAHSYEGVSPAFRIA